MKASLLVLLLSAGLNLVGIVLVAGTLLLINRMNVACEKCGGKHAKQDKFCKHCGVENVIQAG